MGADHGERVAAAAEADRESFELAVGDAAPHPQAGERRASERAGVGLRVARVVHVQRVDAAVAVDRQQGCDRVDDTAHVRCLAAHIHCVVVVAGVDRRGRRDRPDVDRVGAGGGVHRRLALDLLERDRIVAAVRVEHGRAGVGALHRERVAAAAEADRESFERAVGDAAPHTQAGERRASERAGVGLRVARVVHVQRVVAAVAVDREYGSDRVHVARNTRGLAADVHRVGAFAGVDRRGRRDRPDVDRVGAGGGVHRRDARDRFERDGVGTSLTVHRRRASVRARDSDGVGAVAGAHGQRLNLRVGRRHSRPRYRGGGDRDVVGKPGSRHLERVRGAAAAVDVDSRVDQRLSGWVGKAIDHERIVARAAIECDRREVAADRE